MTHTHTYAILEVAQSAWDEIAGKLREAGYGHAFMEDGCIDMHGIAVRADSSAEAESADPRVLMACWAAARVCDVASADILGGSTSTSVARARRLVSAALSGLWGMSSVEIGVGIGRDHTAVLNHIRSVEGSDEDMLDLERVRRLLVERVYRDHPRQLKR